MIAEAVAPSPALRVALEARKSMLHVALADRSSHYALLSIKQLIASFNPRDMALGHTTLANAYLAAVRHLPPWAIHKAVLAFTRGEASEQVSRAFLPSTAELVAEIVLHVTKAAAEHERIANVLEAEIVKDEPLVDVEKLEDLADELRTESDPIREAEEKQRQRHIGLLEAANDRLYEREKRHRQ